MAMILRVKAKWTGFSGAPGYSNFYFGSYDGDFPVDADAADACNKVNGFIVPIKALLPNVVSIQVDSAVELISELNGALLGVLDGDAGGPQVGTAGTGGYAAASGAVITWRTAGIRNGRRIRGRTFIVPLYSSKYGADGSLDGATVSALDSGAAALTASTGTPQFGVWARPTGPAATDGVWTILSSYTVPDMNAVLRSRRD